MLRDGEREEKVIMRLELAGLLRPAAKRSPLPKYRPRGLRRTSLSETVSRERRAKP